MLPAPTSPSRPQGQEEGEEGGKGEPSKDGGASEKDSGTSKKDSGAPQKDAGPAGPTAFTKQEVQTLLNGAARRVTSAAHRPA